MNPSRELNLRQQQRDSTREQILIAATTVFASQGFEAASMAEIAALAGHKKALLQYHFATKHNLWRHTVAHLWALRDRVLPRYLDDDSAGGAEASFRKVLRAVLSFNHHHPEWVALVFRESAQPGERLTWLIDHYLGQDISQGTEFIQRAQQDGLLPSVSPLQLLHLISGALCYTQLVAPMTLQATGTDLASNAAMDEQVDILLRLLQPPN